MTSQANAYYANKLRERELKEVSIPKQRLAERTFEEVDKPKLQETVRSNLANEDIKRKEYQEKVRAKDLDEAFRRDTTMDVPTQLSENQNKNMATVAKGGVANMLAYGSYLTGKSIVTDLVSSSDQKREMQERENLLRSSIKGASTVPGARYETNPQELDLRSVLRGATRAIS